MQFSFALLTYSRGPHSSRRLTLVTVASCLLSRNSPAPTTQANLTRDLRSDLPSTTHTVTIPHSWPRLFLGPSLMCSHMPSTRTDSATEQDKEDNNEAVLHSCPPLAKTGLFIYFSKNGLFLFSYFPFLIHPVSKVILGITLDHMCAFTSGD